MVMPQRAPDSANVAVAHCDVAVIGGAFSGASTAILIKRQRPDLRVLIVEKSTAFQRRVGESTAEVSACFLTRVLGLGTYLGQHHIPKQGLRVWFSKSADDAFDDCSEIGPRYQTRLPAFQVDRSHLDEKILSDAVAAGCELLRPSKVRDVCEMEAGSDLENNASGLPARFALELENSETGRQKLLCRWVVDASGHTALMARKMGAHHELREHPTKAVWARFRNVRDFEGSAMRAAHPEFDRRCRTLRSWSTNHLVGYGWWCWVIPLKDGDFSIGLVYDTRLFEFPKEGGCLGSRLKQHLMTHPVGREWFGEAEVVEGDVHARAQLPWLADRCAGAGWILVGDAAGFMDPLYSPGLDFCAYSVSHASRLVVKDFGQTLGADEIDEYNGRFRESVRTWFKAVYLDKYRYLGDADLMSAAVLLDVACYFIGPVRIVYTCTTSGFQDFPYSGPVGRMFGRFMGTYNRRLAAIAEKRRAAGVYGKNNLNRSELYAGFAPDNSAVKLLFKGVRKWWAAELDACFLKPTHTAVPQNAAQRATQDEIPVKA